MLFQKNHCQGNITGLCNCAVFKGCNDLAAVPVIVAAPETSRVPLLFAVAIVVKVFAATLPVSLTVIASFPRPVNPSVSALLSAALAPYKVLTSDRDPLIAVAFTVML